MYHREDPKMSSNRVCKTHKHIFLFFCQHLKLKHTLTHKAKDKPVLRRMEKASLPQRCHHTSMTVFTNVAHSHSSPPSRERGKRFSAVRNQKWVQGPLGATHLWQNNTSATDVIISQLYPQVSVPCFSLRNNHTDTHSAFVCEK